MLKVLVTDPDPAYAAMIQQVLQETGEFDAASASSGAQTVSLANTLLPDVVLLHSNLEGFSLRDAVTTLRRNQPQLPILVVLPFGEQPLPDAARFFDVQGILSKPLYAPELQAKIQEALTKPVNGVVPPARLASPTPSKADTKPLPPITPKPKTSPPPSWLADVNRAGQYLTTLTQESSAEVALLMRDHDLLAFAGQSDKDESDELGRLVATSWAKDVNSGSTGAQVRFIRLASGSDYLVYSTLAAEDVVLSMAFQAETPLGQIRKQAKRATAALLDAGKADAPVDTTSVSETPVAVEPPQSMVEPAAVETLPVELPPELPQAELETVEQSSTAATEPATVLEDIDWSSFPVKEPTHIPPSFDWQPLSQQTPSTAPLNSIAKDDIEPIDSGLLFTPDPVPTDLDLQDASPLLFAPQGFEVGEEQTTTEPDLDPLPDAASLNELSNTLLQLERQALIEQPPLIDLPPVSLPAVRRTPHALYDLSYTILLIPRLPTNMLLGDLKARLEQWLITLADAYDWEAESILIEPSHIELHLRAAPADSPDYIARTLLTETSDRILTEFPRLATEHAKRPGAFWSPGYFVTTPGRPLSHDEISIFIEYQRREQSGGKY